MDKQNEMCQRCDCRVCMDPADRMRGKCSDNKTWLCKDSELAGSCMSYCHGAKIYNKEQERIYKAGLTND